MVNGIGWQWLHAGDVLVISESVGDASRSAAVGDSEAHQVSPRIAPVPDGSAV